MDPSSPEPRVAVVIASRNRAALLAEALDALAGQTLQEVELLVVDDDSDDDTARLLADRGVPTLRVARGGPGQARQAGWRATTAPVVAFTDDDCVPDRRWLAALLRPIEAGTADFVQGRTVPRPDEVHRLGPWSRTQVVEEPNGFYQTCNMAYRRDVLEALGGFRPEFTGPDTAGEDTDLGWRATEAGYRFAFADEAVVHHAVWPSSFRGFLRDRRRRAMVVQVVRFHPASRRLGHRRYFYSPAHLRVTVTAGVVIGGALVRPWLPLAGAGTAAAVHLARHRSGRRLVHAAQRAAVDAAEVVEFARASIRYRTLFL